MPNLALHLPLRDVHLQMSAGDKATLAAAGSESRCCFRQFLDVTRNPCLAERAAAVAVLTPARKVPLASMPDFERQAGEPGPHIRQRSVACVIGEVVRVRHVPANMTPSKAGPGVADLPMPLVCEFATHQLSAYFL